MRAAGLTTLSFAPHDTRPSAALEATQPRVPPFAERPGRPTPSANTHQRAIDKVTILEIYSIF